MLLCAPGRELLLSDGVLQVVRRHLRSLFKGTKITPEELAAVLTAEVMKRDVLEGDKAIAAAKTVKRAVRRRQRALRADDNEVLKEQSKEPNSRSTSVPIHSSPSLDHPR